MGRRPNYGFQKQQKDLQKQKKREEKAEKKRLKAESVDREALLRDDAATDENT
jgi:hypothetical protein